jgi:spore coat polysaccharide biosynthesis predicted glycosyltransferase SpsG
MDPQGLTPRVVEGLLATDRVVEVVAIVGPEMDARALHAHPRLRVLVEPPTLAEALAGTTVYAGAAGTSAVQAACIGVPAVITVTAANQQAQAAALATAGCALVASPEEVATLCLRLLDDAPRRTQMRRAGRELVDGDGAARVTDAIRRLVRTPAV